MLLAVAVAVAVVTGAQASTSADAGRKTTLRITYWETGSSAVPDAIWTLRCNPPRGTLKRPAVACRKLAKGGPKLFAPVPPKTVCTEICGVTDEVSQSGGVVAGRLRPHHVHAHQRLRDRPLEQALAVAAPARRGNALTRSLVTIGRRDDRPVRGDRRDRRARPRAAESPLGVPVAWQV